MTDRHSQILDALGLGPRWLPRQPLPGTLLPAPDDAVAVPPQAVAASVSAMEAQAPAEALDSVAAPAPGISSQVTPLAAPAEWADTPLAEPVAQTPALESAPVDGIQAAKATGIEPASAAMTEPHLFADAPAAPGPAAPASPADWDSLRAEVAACRRCRLCETRTQTVFARGNPQARWLFVGEAPGEQEDLQGLPFVGPAGKLLDNMLAALDLDRERDVYIANVLKCRPPRNRNPQGDEIAACQPYLRQQIAWQQPAVIVALGRFAAQTLLDTEASIGSLRRREHEYASVPLVVSYHPAYLLRTLPDKAKAWQDLLFAREVLRRQG